MKRTVMLIATLAIAPVALADRWVQVGSFEAGAYTGVVAQMDTATITNNTASDGSMVVTVRYQRPDGQPFSDSAHKQYSQIKETYRVFCSSHRYEDAWSKLVYADGKSEDSQKWDVSRGQISLVATLDNVVQQVCKSPTATPTVAKLNP
ncbi:MAG TPA: hypothetical protein VHZ99_14480 [Steroidobacteraceae bacterium]|nr:hypothetical protein [Steroidobacteraceae bacterium]